MNDFPGKEHAAGLAPDCAASDHAVPQFKIVPGFEILFYHFLKMRVFGHSAFKDLLFRFLTEITVLIFQFRQGKEAVIAAIVLILKRIIFFFQKLIISAHGHTARDRLEFLILPAAGMYHKHFGGVAVPHLQRVEINLVAAVNVQKELGSVPDFGDGVQGMTAADNRKIGRGI